MAWGLSVLNTPSLSVAFAGVYVKPGRDRDALAALLLKEGYLPVWIDSHLLDLYYNGFCNR